MQIAKKFRAGCLVKRGEGGAVSERNAPDQDSNLIALHPHILRLVRKLDKQIRKNTRPRPRESRARSHRHFCHKKSPERSGLLS
ncbi:hypothetical protein AGR3A_Cc260035 [Agrobacterium tomkonis CFBP 6623]|uniref:Uncharacterized protein n=1 Tax=Agrobacterium tomkonis CFBP 6623 TaxID=1183432 RepID=A0A1S7PGQ5_9HYPH|nr:hypothetical protein AGR3A_Cc260035 [Agrobacterium tomkonis CFBP 6623]